MNERVPIPLYHQVYVLLREKILSGQWERGDFFPTEQELSKSLNVSRVTVRRALGLLADENLLRRFQGRGTLVASGVMTRPVTANIAAQLDNAISLGRQTTVELLRYEWKVPRPEIAAALGLADGADAHVTVRVRSLSGTPVSRITTVVPRPVAGSISREDLISSTPVLALIERSVALEEAEQAIGATLADERTSETLALPLGAPLLEVKRLVFATGHIPVMHSVALYNPDYYQYRLTLKAAGEPGGRPGMNLYD